MRRRLLSRAARHQHGAPGVVVHGGAVPLDAERIVVAGSRRQVGCHRERVQLRSPDHVPLYVDVTGIGPTGLELFRDAGLQPVGVTLTAGAAQAQPGPSDLRVPKRDLAGLVQVGLQTERLKIAAGLPLTPTLARELATFKVKVNLAAPDGFEAWREGEHDDLVLAASLACWGAERRYNRPRLMFV